MTEAIGRNEDEEGEDGRWGEEGEKRKEEGERWIEMDGEK